MFFDRKGGSFLEQNTFDTSNDRELVDLLKEKNDSLENKNRMLTAFLENSPDAIQISDKNLITIMVNKAYEVLTGINRAEQIGVPVMQLVKKNLLSESCASIVKKTKKPHTIIQTFSRTQRSAHVTCSPVFGDDGEIEYYICNDRDINEINSLHSELRETKALSDHYLMELETLRNNAHVRNKLIIEDRSMIDVFALANKISKVDTTILLLGETGVGKDEISRYIHNNSSRRNNAFISVNCGAIAESQFESVLFGYEGNSFAGYGKKNKTGLFEVADKGTLFLDEIGELSMDMQKKLLQVLQNRSFIRVGGTKTVNIDVRIIAATNRDLEQMVQDGLFREDLYYRLNVISISVPPLRSRKNDILPLANHFLGIFNKRYNMEKSLSPKANYTLLNYNWPGNIRQLKNTIEHAVILSESNIIDPEHLALPVTSARSDMSLPELKEEQGLKELLEQTELKYLNMYYEKYGNIRAAAKKLKMSPTTFLRHKNEYENKYGKI